MRSANQHLGTHFRNFTHITQGAHSTSLRPQVYPSPTSPSQIQKTDDRSLSKFYQIPPALHQTIFSNPLADAHAFTTTVSQNRTPGLQQLHTLPSSPTMSTNPFSREFHAQPSSRDMSANRRPSHLRAQPSTRDLSSNRKHAPITKRVPTFLINPKLTNDPGRELDSRHLRSAA